MNLRLHPKILQTHRDGNYGQQVVDSTDGSGIEWKELDCTEGLVLKAGYLYLGSTIEEAGSDWVHSRLDGRSSGGRMFLSIHETAGYGDLGFKSQWTLEMCPKLNIKVYAGQYICQISFYNIDGKRDSKLYGDGVGRYSGQQGPTPSKGFGKPVYN